MSPDLWFAFTLIVKMAVTAGFLLAATITRRARRPADRRAGGDAADQRRPGLHLPRARPRRALHRAKRARQSGHQCLQHRLRAELCAAGAKTLARGQPRRRVRHLARVDLGRRLGRLDACFGDRAQYRRCSASPIWLSAPLRHAPMPRVQTRWYDLVLRAGMVALAGRNGGHAQLPHRRRPPAAIWRCFRSCSPAS